MKRIIPFILISILLLPLALKTSVFVWYFQNKSYIATTLCVNQDKPELQCEGQCVLANKLKKLDCCTSEVENTASTDTKESHPAAPVGSKPSHFEISPYILSSTFFWISDFEFVLPERNFQVAHIHSRLNIGGIFQPPREA